MRKIGYLLALTALVASCYANKELEPQHHHDESDESIETHEAKTVPGTENLDDLILSADLDAVETPTGVPFAPSNTVTLKDTQNVEPHLQIVAKVVCGSYYHRAYKPMNDYLVDKTEEQSPATNMKIIIDRLNQELAKANIFNKCFIGGLRQFVALSSLTPENKCSWHSFKIIYMNDRATGGKTHKTPSKVKTLTRIERLVYDYSVGHAIDCQDRYPETYNRIVTEMDQNKLNIVVTFLDHLVEKALSKKSKFMFFNVKKKDEDFDILKLIGDVKSFKGDIEAKVAYNTIRAFSKDDWDKQYLKRVVDEKTAKLVVRSDKIKSLMDKYLIEPCIYYLESLGPHVYIPAGYDALVLRREDRYRIDNPKIADFVHGWVRYKLCDVLVKKDQNSLASGIAKVVSKVPVE